TAKLSVTLQQQKISVTLQASCKKPYWTPVWELMALGMGKPGPGGQDPAETHGYGAIQGDSPLGIRHQALASCGHSLRKARLTWISWDRRGNYSRHQVCLYLVLGVLWFARFAQIVSCVIGGALFSRL
ncbi:hypothetical protein PVW46_22195, partial [Mameliella sp. AT18]|uniref:hypothetical protein n=1 Tax=Mameliella sp. AT18 TaxID=3028385 RepID=UPI00237A9BAC